MGGMGRASVTIAGMKEYFPSAVGMFVGLAMGYLLFAFGKSNGTVGGWIIAAIGAVIVYLAARKIFHPTH
jgi:hypothetical protein